MSVDLETLGQVLADTSAPYTDDVPYVAAEPLSPLHAVRLSGAGQVRLARPPEVEALAPLGVTVSSAQTGGSVMLRRRGVLQDPFFSFTPGLPVLLGIGGTLVQGQPAGLMVQLRIGWAIATDTIVIRIGEPLQLAG